MDGAERFTGGRGTPWRPPTLILPGGTGDPIVLRIRPLTRSDGTAWRQLRIHDEEHLRPVEPTLDLPWEEAHSPAMWRTHYRGLARARRLGVAAPFAIEADGEFVGQLTLGNIQRGTAGDCWIGYWVHSALQGRGIATAAVALGTDMAMLGLGVHRVEATVMPGNHPSRWVLANTGYRVEGYLKRNLHIDGAWTDHILVAQTVEEIGVGICQRLAKQGRFSVA